MFASLALETTGEIALAVLALVVVVLGGLDAIFKRFETGRKLWRGVVAVARYLRDLFLAPIKVRELEKWRASSATQAEPVHHLGAVWLPSDVEDDAFVPFCQHCWGEGRRIALECHTDRTWKRMYCRYNQRHGATSIGDPMVVDLKDFEHACAHVYDRRRRIGA